MGALMCKQTVLSSLDSVIVYREGAMCTRRARIEPSDGREVRIAGLPLSMEPGSLRARVLSGSLQVLDVRPQFDVQLADGVDVPAEKQAQQAAQETLARLQRVEQRLQHEINELQELRPRFPERRRGDPAREAPVPALLALTDFVEAELAKRLELRRRLSDEIAEAARELDLRTHRLAETSTAMRTERARLGRVALITLSEAPQQAFDLAVEYQVPGARWVPTYQMKLAAGMGSGVLLLRASVAQQTGEDWTDVHLALSTASLLQRTDLPELRSLRIGRQQTAPPRSGWREPPPGLDDLFAGYDALLPIPALAAAGPAPSQAPSPRKTPKKMRPASGGAAAPAPPAPGLFLGAAAAAPVSVAAACAPSPAAPARRMASSDFAAMSRPSMLKQETFEGTEPNESAEPPPEPPPPEASLDEARQDYGRLVMPGPGSPGRGRLQPLQSWDLMFAVGVSVQIDVVAIAVAKAHQQALEVRDLPLQGETCPVTSVESFDYRYDCASPGTVRSTNHWTSVPVMICEVGLSPEYLCVPAVEPKVYRTLQIQNRSPHALLPGPVDVSLGDEFLMTTRLPAILPKAKGVKPLGLGVEEAIKVARQTHFKETSGGLLGGATLLPHEIEVTVHNRLSTPARIEVRERVPWVDSEHEKDVKVEETQVTPAWERIEQPLDGQSVVHGARRWVVSVPAGQAQTLHAAFTIRLPSDRVLVGGNRRG